MAEQVQRVPKEEQAELKKRIRMLKAKRDEAIGQKDSKKVSSLRRGIRSLKRRTRVVSVFPNAKSCERLVTAMLMEISEDWETGMRYLTMPENTRAGCGSTPVRSSEPKRGSGQDRAKRAAKRA